MPRNGSGVFQNVPGTTVTPNTTIQSAWANAFSGDVQSTFNTAWPVSLGGNGVTDNKPLTNSFGLRDNADLTKLGIFDASQITTGTTRTYALPNANGTLALTSGVAVAASGLLFNLTMSNNVTDAVNDIDFTTGNATDSTNAVVISLNTPLTKRLDAVWAAGTNQGGRFTAAIADTTWFWYLIYNPTTGVVDIGASTNVASPAADANYPAGFTYFRRIGATIRAVIGVSTIIPFTQLGDQFLWKTTIVDITAANPGTAAVTRTLTVPTGLKVQALIRASLTNTGSASASTAYLSSLDQNDEAPGTTAGIAQLLQVASATTGSVIRTSQDLQVRTNASGQIRSRLGFSDANVTLGISTYGYIDTRGRG